MKKYILISLCLIVYLSSYAGDSATIKVHFLYGSKPAKGYKDCQPKWFGGILGGHVGIEADSDQIINFVPHGEFHYISHSKKKNSQFIISNYIQFYSIMGGNGENMKKLIIEIPVTKQQKHIFDSISKTYTENVPFDYAFIGFRCGAAAYEILSHLDIVPKHNRKMIVAGTFYPRKLRTRLIKLAKAQHWKMTVEKGTIERKWERDVVKFEVMGLRK